MVNPTKVDDLVGMRRACERAAAEAGWAEPLWLETTIEDPGPGQTRQAVDAGCDIVFAAGGDGTVRYVGSVLAGTGVPLGLLPQGTGNLLARNLGIAVEGSAADNFSRSLRGRNTVIDVGRIEATLDDGSVVNDSFLIMAGFGLDGTIMEVTSEDLKKRIGWMAYPIAGLPLVTERPQRMVASFDDGPPRTKKTTTLIVGNCGKLTGGVHLMPNALADDGAFDAVWMSADGPLQWGALARQIFAQKNSSTPRMERISASRVSAEALGDTRPLELDGDVIAHVRSVRFMMDRRALGIRVWAGPLPETPREIVHRKVRSLRARRHRTGATRAE